MKLPPDERDPAACQPTGSQPLPTKDDDHEIANAGLIGNVVSLPSATHQTVLGAAQVSTVLPFPEKPGELRRMISVVPNGSYPGEWLVGLFYHDPVKFVGIASFLTRLDAIDFAVTEAEDLGGLRVDALRSPERDGEPNGGAA